MALTRRQTAEALVFGALGGLLWGLAARSLNVGLMTALLTFFACRLPGGEVRHRYVRWTVIVLFVGLMMLLTDRYVLPFMAADTARR